MASLRADDGDKRSLVRAAQRGDKEAIEQLVDAYWHRAWRASMSVLLDSHRAEDLAQEAMVKAIAGLKSFDPERPFGPWLERIVVNACLDWLRRSSNQELPADRMPEPYVEDCFSDPELVASLEALQSLDRAMIVMRHVLGHRVTEIAEMVGLSETATSSRLHRAMNDLRSTLTQPQEVIR